MVRIFWVKKSFGFTSPSVAKNIRRIVSGVGYLLPSMIRQIAAGDKLHRRANFAWLMRFDFKYSDKVILFFNKPVDTLSMGMQLVLTVGTTKHRNTHYGMGNTRVSQRVWRKA